MDKLDRLKRYLKELGKVAIAYSGGVDSSFLMEFAVNTLGTDNVIGINIVSPFQSKREEAELKRICNERNWNIVHIMLNQLEDEQISQNSTERCYYCKKSLFKGILIKAEELGYSQVLDGSNYDDLGDYRPGMKAIKELGIKSPMLELEFTKEDIRNFSKEMDLETWDKPAAACLASRVPYGDTITKEHLQRIEGAENILEDLGYSGFRVRHHGELARIELQQENIDNFIKFHRELVYNEFRELGFIFVTLDLKGYEMGTLNLLKGS